MIYSTYRNGGEGRGVLHRVTKDGVEEWRQNYEGKGLCHVSLDATETVLLGRITGWIGRFLPRNRRAIGQFAS